MIWLHLGLMELAVQTEIFLCNRQINFKHLLVRKVPSILDTWQFILNLPNTGRCSTCSLGYKIPSAHCGQKHNPTLCVYV